MPGEWHGRAHVNGESYTAPAKTAIIIFYILNEAKNPCSISMCYIEERSSLCNFLRDKHLNNKEASPVNTKKRRWWFPRYQLSFFVKSSV